MSQLKKTIWSIDNDIDNRKTPNGFSFGETKNKEPAIKIGNKTFTIGDFCVDDGFKTISKISDYLYKIVYDEIEYDYAREYLENEYKPEKIGCSSVRCGQYFGRNFDWYYNEQAEFVVITKKKTGRYASIGVASGLGKLTKEVVESGEFVDEYRVLPMFLVDGINENSVFACVNLVPADKGITYGTIPTGEKKITMSTNEIVRYILDNFDSATDAVSYLRKYVSIYENKKLIELGYMTHFMIGDAYSTYVVEFVNNEIVIIPGQKILTNFYIDGVVFNDGTAGWPREKGTVNVPDPDMDNPVEVNNVTEYGSGLERYNTLLRDYETFTSKSAIESTLCNKLKFTNLYNCTDDFWWYSDCVGGPLTLRSPIDDFYDAADELPKLYYSRSRKDNKTWQTSHTSIYDIKQKKLYIHNQEGENEYCFSLKKFEDVALSVEEFSDMFE